MGGRYLVRKFLQALLTIVFIVLLNFLLFRAMPGSPDRAIARNLPAGVREQLFAKWGLDKPLLPDQLVTYLGDVSRFDLGDSFKFDDSVGPLLRLVHFLRHARARLLCLFFNEAHDAMGFHRDEVCARGR